MRLEEQKMYRLSPTMYDTALCGKTVVFLGYVNHFDINRAKVALLNPNGSLGTEYLVAPLLVIPRK